MGFLSLFSRKPSSAKLSSKLVKAQAYDATVASEPPQRGAYPVAGNGPNVLDSLSKSTRFKSTQFPIHLDIEDSSAPAPSVPRFREENNTRPKTAPNSSKSGTKESFKRQSSFRGRTLSFRKSRIISVPASPSPSETPEFTQYGQGFVQVFPSAPPALSASLAAAISKTEESLSSHRRNRSILSEGGRSVDLLDAQYELSPGHSDPRTRVQAAGLKGFGEDVADRNIALHLNSSHVQAFYTPASESKKRPPNRDFPLTAIAKERPLDSSPNRSQATNLTKSTSLRLFPDHRLSTNASASNKTTNENSSLLKASTTGLQRQGSLSKGTYVPTGSTPGMSSHNSARVRPLSLHRIAQSRNKNKNKNTSTAPSLPERPATSWNPDTQDLSPHIPHYAHIPHYVPQRQEEDEEAEVESIRQAATRSRQSSHPANKFHSRFQAYQAKSDSRPDISSNRGSVPSTSMFAPTTDPRPPSSSGRNGSHVLELSASFAVSDGSDWFAGLGDAKSAPSPCVTTSHSLNECPDPKTPDNRRCTRVRSMLLPPRNGCLEDIYELVPERTSSIRNWSIRSDTPSLSSFISSNAAVGQRPSSVQTPDTSIDYSFHVMKRVLSSKSLLPPRSRGSIYSTNARGQLEIVPDTPEGSRGFHDENFNIDDYISSDDDSFTAKRNPRIQYEENLLFRDAGYGKSGTQLPGLSISHHVMGSAPMPLITCPAPYVSPPRPVTAKSPSKSSLSLAGRSSHSIKSIRDAHGDMPKSSSRRRSCCRPGAEAENSSDGDVDSPRRKHGHRRGSRQLSPSRWGRKGAHRLSAVGADCVDKIVSRGDVDVTRSSCFDVDFADQSELGKLDVTFAARRHNQVKTAKRGGGGKRASTGAKALKR